MKSPSLRSVAPAPGEQLDLTIEKIVFGGDGLARTPHGFIVFVPFSAPGERVRVRITERKSQHARSEIVEVLEPVMSRVAPPCPYYAHCGGCQYQHLDYAEQGRIKEQQVYEALTRVGKLAEPRVLPMIASPADYGYRNRITVHAEAGRIGFRALDGRELVDIRACIISRDAVNAELARLRAGRPADGHYSLRDPGVPESGFFQANQSLHETLQKLVADSMPERGDVLLEGYCGGGFFTQHLAGRFHRVVAVDNDSRPLRDAQRLGLTTVDWRQGDAAVELISELETHTGQEVAVLLDPPREGLPVPLTDALCHRPAAHLTYVSCNPATLARDARRLISSYELVSVQPIDCFPQTAQIECVSVWKQRA